MSSKSELFTISLTDKPVTIVVPKKTFRFKPFLFLIPIISIPIISLSLIALVYASSRNTAHTAGASNKLNPLFYSLFSAKPKVLGATSQSFEGTDPRPHIIKQFYQGYYGNNAPLANYANFIVDMADKYSIDWRLVPAIGMCESNGGKSIPEDSYNAWGWAASEKDLAEKTGIYNNNSWEAGIERVTKGLKNAYYHLIDPSDGIDFDEIWTIMRKYTPPSEAKGGPWAKCVWQYYSELTDFQTPI